VRFLGAVLLRLELELLDGSRQLPDLLAQLFLVLFEPLNVLNEQQQMPCRS
jgi:hypothetical protein